jgi:hypothetical protein
MNLSQFFGSLNVRLPIGGFNGATQTFDFFLRDAYERYAETVREIDDSDFPGICSEVQQSLPLIDQLSDNIVEAVKNYLEGYPHLAYKEIEKSLGLVAIEELCSSLSGSQHVGAFPNDAEFFLERVLHPPLFRVRADKAIASGAWPSRGDIFHVPFESRQRVANQRYSIAGLPCLYLGSSVWICWEELNRPELDSIWLSRFRLVEEVKVLDFQFSPTLAWHVFGVLTGPKKPGSPAAPKELSDRFDEHFIASYIRCWPLIAACSVKTECGEGPFFPQYIVPQMLLQWVTKEKRVDGIRYFSTRTPPEDADAYAYCSYVFPARNISSVGQCSYLQKKFHLTSPISWDFLQIVNINESYFGPSNAQAVVKVSNDFRVFYWNTEFFEAENKLGVMETRAGLSGPVESKV